MGIDFRNRNVWLIVPLALLAPLVVLASLIAAWPFAEGGYIDDFSYVHMAKTLAETGRFAYNGWPTAMLGIQVWWGAAWVWLFGFSFWIVRLSVLPLALGAVTLVYLIARRASLSSHDSLFAALLTGLSTLFLPLASTFMSDVPALFFLLACLYGFVRAADAEDQVSAHGQQAVASSVGTSSAIAWLAVGTVCGLLGGTIRQTVWFAPVTCAAVLCLRRSGGTRFRICSLCCGVLGLAAIILGTQWFNRQPYVVPTRLPSLDSIARFEAAHVLREALTVAAECVLKVLPALLFCMPWIVTQVFAGMRARWGRIMVVGTAAAMVAVLAGTLSGRFEGLLGLLGGSWRPTGLVVHDLGVGLIRSGVLGLLVAVMVAAIVALEHARTAAPGARRIPPAVVLPLVALVPYAASLLMVSQTTAGIYPRYYLPFLPALSCGLLFVARPSSDVEHPAARRSLLGWLLVGFFALRGIAILHDEFADTRTRLAAIALLQQQGVPRERITSKWVIDGWEQIERCGHVNDPRIVTPPDTYVADGPNDYPDPVLKDRFPALRPEYMVVDDREITPGKEGEFPRFPFRAWWRPPYLRTIVIRTQQLPDGPGGKL